MRTLVILAGGKSSRMGQDKVLLELNGMTFIERIFKNALVCFERIIISTDSDAHADRIKALPAFAHGSAEFVTDRYDSAGPIGGILSVFEAVDADRFSVISVDVPFADMRVLAMLYDRCAGKAAFLQTGDGRPEPLIAAWSRSAFPDIRRAFEQGHFKMRMVLDKDDINIVTSGEVTAALPELSEADIAECFRNYNTQDDLLQIGRVHG